MLAGPLQTATWKGKPYAAPINSNTELLWYRKDLVPNPPKTRNQMIDDAIAPAKKGKPHYIQEQGAKYEGLTVWFNSLVNSAGGGILTKDNKIIVGRSSQVAAQQVDGATPFQAFRKVIAPMPAVDLRRIGERTSSPTGTTGSRSPARSATTTSTPVSAK